MRYIYIFHCMPPVFLVLLWIAINWIRRTRRQAGFAVIGPGHKPLRHKRYIIWFAVWRSSCRLPALDSSLVVMFSATFFLFTNMVYSSCSYKWHTAVRSSQKDDCKTQIAVPWFSATMNKLWWTRTHVLQRHSNHIQMQGATRLHLHGWCGAALSSDAAVHVVMCFLCTFAEAEGTTQSTDVYLLQEINYTII